jgi:hypothetical protein
MSFGSIAIAGVVAAIVFAVGVLARPSGSAVPPADVFPLFGVLMLLESLAFGVGASYLLRSRRTLFAAAVPPLERATAWCIAYLLLAPWPHDFLHALTLVNGMFNWPALAGIEYVFHLGVVPVGLVVAAYVARTRALRRA